MIGMGYLILLLIFELMLFFIAFTLSGKDIMAPSVMMCIMFLISTCFTLLNVERWNIHYSLEACILISTGILTFVMAETIFRFVFCRQLKGNKQIQEYHDVCAYDLKTWKLILFLAFNMVVCILYLRNIVSTVGENLSNLSSYFVAYRRLGISALKDKGTSGVRGYLHPLLWVVTASGYVSIYLFINNWIAGRKVIYKQVCLLLTLVVSAFPDMMSGGRTGILKLGSAVLITYYILWHQKNGWTRNLSWKYIRVGIVSLFVGIPAFYYSLGMLGRTTDRSIGDYVSYYLGASIENFNQYLKAPVKRGAWGEECLVSVKKVLHYVGLGEISHSYNLEFRSIGSGSSNIYTFFRRPLHDFGIAGMYLFVALIGFFFAWMYFKKIKYKEKRQTISWVLIYGYFYYWMICSSMIQYSQNFISAGAVIVITLILMIFHFITMDKFNRKIKIPLKS